MIRLGLRTPRKKEKKKSYAHASRRPSPCILSPRCQRGCWTIVGAPSVATSAHANRAGASGEVDVADDGTHAAGGVAALEWLSANLGGGATVSTQMVGGVHISANDDAQSDDNDDGEASVLEVILGRQVGQREDTACDEDGVDVSVGVDVDAVGGVGVHGHGVNLGVSLGVGIVVGSPPLTPLDSQGARLRSGSLMT